MTAEVPGWSSEFQAGSSGRENGHRQRRNDQKNDLINHFDFQVGR
jgi:hypothetical protein